MKKGMKNMWVGLLLLFTSLGLHAQEQGAERFNVLYLNMEHGLPNNYVDDIFADSDGFVWIATHGGGLMRYDGFSILDFGVGSPGLQLPSNSCRNICEDKFHRLWVSFDEFTAVLDLNTLKPATLTTPRQDVSVQEVLQERSLHVCCDEKGKIWVVTMDNIYCIVFDERGDVKQLYRFATHSNTPDVFIGDLDGDGKPWAAFGGSLRKLAVDNGKISASNISPKLNGLPVAFITDVARHQQQFWIATNNGLYVYDPFRNEVTAYRHATTPGISHDYVSALTTDAEGQLMVGTLQGIDVVSGTEPTIRHLDIEKTAAGSSNFVNCLRTICGQLWVGTEGGGIVRYVARQLNVRHYIGQKGADSQQSAAISAGAVNIMLTQDDGTLWVGTVEGGLNRKRPGSDVFTHYTSQNSGLTHNSVSALAMSAQRGGSATGGARPQELYIGTWGGGLNVLSLDGPAATVRPLPVDASYQPLLNFIGALQYDSINQAIWIGSNDGIFCYDLAKGVVYDPFPGCRNFRGCIGSIVLSDGHLWMGCLEGTVDIDLTRRPFRYEHYKYLLDQPDSRIIDKITCFCQASDGTLWLGSNGYGLYKRTGVKKGRSTFAAYRVSDGLSNNAVRGIAEGQNGMLWVTTVHGLSHFNPRTAVFTNYHEEDGLLSSQFYWNSAQRAHDGSLYFGSDKGLTALYDANTAPPYKGRLHFTLLTVNNQMAEAGGPYISQNIALARRITLRESDKSFNIEFSALHYGNETQGIYSYRMKGFEQEWTPLPAGQHSVRYTSLPPGDYVFEVRYASAYDAPPTADGDGAEQLQVPHISIDVHVAPYFWKTWWFLLLLATAALLSLSYFLRRMHLRRLQLAKQQEAERLMRPIEEVLRESEDPYELQQRIQTILDGQQRYLESSKKSVEADVEEAQKNVRPFMERVMEIMEKNYMNSEFDVADFCQQIGMSRSLLAKKLNEHTGQSTSQFIRSYRLDIAKQILMRGDHRNIAEIAFSVGFNDPKYFTRCFTRQYGATPSSFLQ